MDPTPPTEFLVWTADMELGHPTIDDQHKSLAELVGQLQRVPKDEDRRQVEYILKQLEYYVLIHFSFEEEWMQKEAFADLAEHVSEHRQFELVVGRFKEQFQSGDQVSEVLSEYLVHWLRHHIMTVDRKYAVRQGL